MKTRIDGQCEEPQSWNGRLGWVLMSSLLPVLFCQECLAAPSLDLSRLPGLRLQGEDVALTGAALTRADLNQDGVADLVLAAPQYGTSSNGRIYRVEGCQALSGKEQTSTCQICPSLPDEEDLQSLPLATLPTVQTLTGEDGQALGHALAWVALEGDDVPALVVSAVGEQKLFLYRGDSDWTEPFEPDMTLKEATAYNLQVSRLSSSKEVLWIEQLDEHDKSVSWWRLDDWPSASTSLDRAATKLSAAQTGLAADPWSIAPFSTDAVAVVAATDGTRITVLDVESLSPLCQSEHPLPGSKLVGWLKDADLSPALLVYDPDTSTLALAPFSWQREAGGLGAPCLADGTAWQEVELTDLAHQLSPGSFTGELSFLPFPDLIGEGMDALVLANANNPGEVVVLEGYAIRSGELQVLLRVLPHGPGTSEPMTSNFGYTLAQLDLDGNQFPDLVVGASESSLKDSGSVFILFDLVQYLDHDGDGLLPYRGSGLGAASYDCDDADPGVMTPFPDALGEGFECLHVDTLIISDEQAPSCEPGGCLSVKTQQILVRCPQGAFFPLFGLGSLFWRRRGLRKK